MKANLNFEQDDTKKLLAKLDFEFFLKENISEENYNANDITEIYISYVNTLKEIKVKSKSNHRQFKLYSEGQVRKMFTGGFLPALFGLDESRGHKIFDFQAVGDNWAYFKHWQSYQKRKVNRERIWDIIIKTGSILAIILSAIKFSEYLSNK